MFIRAALCCLVVFVAGVAPVGAQDIGFLQGQCVASAPGTASGCAEAAVAARALMGHIGLLSALGSSVPGAASTLGRRLGNTPRVSVSLRGAGLQLRMPDLTDRQNQPAGEVNIFVPTLHGNVALGLFDGFRLMPTVGGFLSVDFVGQTSVAFLPRSEGFSGKVSSLGLGARIGILTESFTLPGISLSVMRNFHGTVSFANATLGDPAQVDLDPGTTSYRLTVGKDLLAVGLVAGVGWDSYSANASILLNSGTGVIASTADVGAGRKILFGGAALNFLILQLSAEVGWAQGLEATTGYTGAPFDPTKGTIFAGLSARLTI